MIVSGGRTGTSFLGEVAGFAINDAWSIHEPDVWDGMRRSRSWRAIRWFGPYHATIGKILRRTGMLALTERYRSGDWSAERTAEAIIRQRTRFYERRPEGLVIESNYQWFGLLPVLPMALANYRVLAIVRDPRTWVRSWMNFGGHHDESDALPKFGIQRLNPALVGQEELSEWDRMDTFQRLCWDWKYVAELLVEADRSDPRVNLVRFEDIFLVDDAERNLRAALESIGSFGGRSYHVDLPAGVLARPANASVGRRMGSWDDWPDERKQYLLRECSHLMQTLGYD